MGTRYVTREVLTSGGLRGLLYRYAVVVLVTYTAS